MAEETKVEEVKVSEEKAEVKANPLERKVQIHLPKAEFEKEVNKKLREKAKKAHFHGFRPGKAPFSMVESAYGPEIRNEVLNQMAMNAFFEAVAKEKLNPVGYPNMYPLDGGEDHKDDLSFDAVFEVMPEVKEPDYKAMKVTEYTGELTDEDLKKTLDVMQKQRATYEKVDRPSKEGDKVVVDFCGKLDGNAFEGGTAKGYAFVLGQGRMLPEFEAAVNGMSAGETKTFPLTFPENYGAKNLAGKTVEFEVTVKEVAEEKLPELNDEFAKELGIEGGVEALKKEVRSNLERELGTRLRNKTKQSVMDALLAAADFPVPHPVVESQRQELVESTIQNMNAQGLKLSAKDIPANAMLDQAEKRVRLGLILSEVIKANKIEATKDEMRAFVAKIGADYEDPQMVIDWYLNDPKRAEEIAAVVIEDKAVDVVLKAAQVTKENLPFEEVMKA